MATTVLDTDYLVVGAGAMGMAFTDALIDHADVHVTLVDRRHAAGGHDHHADAGTHVVTSGVSGKRTEVRVRRRVVDATYLSPTIPATSSPPFDAADEGRVVPIGRLADLCHPPDGYVIVGSGKTATDGIVWLLTNGVEPDRITWVRPREPWMLNRSVVQPDPAVALGLAADTMAAAADASSLDDLFLRLEAAGVMLRIDTDLVPTMAKTPTVAEWELALLRTIEHVVRLGHIVRITDDEIVLDHGVVPIARDALVVHCAASGLRYRPLVPIWGRDVIRIQTIRAGFPCFNAALAGYVEATRDDDRERNRLCPPTNLPDSPADWAQMQVRGALASAAFGAEPDIAAWADTCALNPARTLPEQRTTEAVAAARARLDRVAADGLVRLAALGGVPLPRRDARSPGGQAG